MDSGLNVKWKHQFLYLAFIYTVLYLVHTSILRKLSVGHEQVRIKRSPDLPLRFRSDGTFKILQVADMHYGNGVFTRCRDVLASEFRYCSDLNTTQFVKRLIQAEKPDFIVYTGDNIYGPSSTDAAESLYKAFDPAIDAGLPWAAVLGNHDEESTMNREELMSLISLLDYSVSQINPSVENQQYVANGSLMNDIDGYGNYHLGINGPPGSHLANRSILDLFFLDSGHMEVVEGRLTYGWIKESQLHWLFDLSKKLEDERQDSVHSTAPIPALSFFHIPIPEIRQLYNRKIIGHFQEAVACSAVNSGVLQTFVSMGIVKAVFMGHDHNNDFCGNLDGIWFCYGGGSGYHAYGRAGWTRRARIIQAELQRGKQEWLGVGKITTWKRLDDEKLSVIDSQLLWNSP